jgi:hypothetical protein
VQWGFVHTIGKSTVHEWLRNADLKPHRIRRWLHSPDPDFRKRASLQTPAEMAAHSIRFTATRIGPRWTFKGYPLRW